MVIEIVAEKLDDVVRFLRTFPRRLVDGEKRARHKALVSLRGNVRSEIIRQGLYETGGYFRSVRIVGDDTVTTDDPAAMRHEFGFVGTDALGRHYTDPPRPHWRPAILIARQEYPENILKEVRTLVDER